MANGRMNGVGTDPVAGLGDIAPASVDPMERYYRIVRGQVQLPRRGWIVNPKWVPPVIQGGGVDQEIIEQHLIPRQWQLLEDFYVMLQRGRFPVKNPNWIEPPITAEMEDLVSETPISVGATDTVIASYTVPDRCVAAFKAFGHMLDSAAQWGTVIWNIYKNEAPIRTYKDFLQQRGTVVSPTPFPKPITLRGKDVIKITARTAGAAVNAIVRMQGFVVAVETVTQDGSYRDWNSK